MRGTEVDASLAVTLVHELTHVLQDQTFGLDGLVDEEATSGEAFALRALVEGDAVRIEDRYIAEELTDEEVAEIDGTNEEGLEELDEEAIPESLQAFFGLPYVLGGGLMASLEADGGEDAVDEAFEDPPRSEEHLVDPLSYLDDDEVLEVALPPTEEGDEVLDEGDFGAASLYIVLAQRVPVLDALDAVLGWGGDAYVDVVRDGTSCVRIDVVGDTDEDTAELLAALEAWVAAAPPGSASVAEVDDVVRLDSCDPGIEAVAAPGSSIDALTVLQTRSFLVADGLDQRLPDDFVTCYARAILGAFTIEELGAEELPPDFQSRLDTAAASCS